ncbi:MAG TPA: hypothetical protein VJZ71_11140 [Phycisphaerae bacterium]|nr:hypothetical protein [Phycisphaerae bacterium]
MTLEFEAIEFDTADEALQHFCASGYGDAVITLSGKSYVIRQAEADRLAAAGCEFAYLCDHEMPDGTFRIMTVPVN